MPKKYDRYASPVAGTPPEKLAPKMRASIDAVLAQWPADTLVTLFILDQGAHPGDHGSGLAYISNADRADMILAVREWLRRQETLA